MCLTRLDKPKRTTGIGWKMVKPTDKPGVYRPCWIYFSESGGVGDDAGILSSFTTSVRYQVGKVTKSDAPEGAKAEWTVRYKPGIHVFLKKPHAQSHDSIPLICLRVEYRGAYAADDTQLVCKAVKVLGVVRAKKQAEV